MEWERGRDFGARRRESNRCHGFANSTSTGNGPSGGKIHLLCGQVQTNDQAESFFTSAMSERAIQICGFVLVYGIFVFWVYAVSKVWTMIQTGMPV